MIADTRSSRQEAAAWLVRYLTRHGPTNRRAVLAEAALHGHAPNTLQRAFKEIHGISRHSGYPRRAEWALPNQEPRMAYTARFGRCP